MEKNRRIFIWKNFEPLYNAGFAIAIANSEEEAKQMVRNDYGRDIAVWGELEVLSIKQNFCYAVGGNDG